MMWRGLSLALVFLGLGLVCHATAADVTVSPNVANGQKLFHRHCTGCHGPTGKGDGYALLGPTPADLTAPAMAGTSDADLLATLHRGRPNMPPWNKRLSEQQRRDVIAYVRTLAQ